MPIRVTLFIYFLRLQSLSHPEHLDVSRQLNSRHVLRMMTIATTTAIMPTTTLCQSIRNYMNNRVM